MPKVAAYRDNNSLAIAEEYAAATSSYDGFPGLREELHAFVERLELKWPVLDLGAGAGRDSRQLRELGLNVAACDTCMPLLRFAEGSCGQNDGPASICMNMLDIPFRDDTFGGVWACGSLLHIPIRQIPNVLGEIIRVMRPFALVAINLQAGSVEGWRTGGTLSSKRWFSLIAPGDFKSLMSRAGFEDIQYEFVGRACWYSATGVKS